jgi:hypothetical protein
MSARQMLEDIAKKKMEINMYRGEKVFHIAKKKDTIRRASQCRLIKGSRVRPPKPPSVEGVFEGILGRSTNISHQRLRTMSVAMQVSARMKMAKMRADIDGCDTDRCDDEDG